MAVNNSIAPAKKPRFSVAIQSDKYQELINKTLQNPAKAQRFIAAITSAVAVNPALSECDAGTILSGALLGEALNLSPSPQLGQYYLVPFKKKNADPQAQFILGYKGYLQLAIRSGQYKKINVLSIKKGELIKYDPMEEEIEVKLIEDDLVRDATPTIGYFAYFEYINGFRKAMYWSKDKMLAHADKYSKAFSINAVKAKDPQYSKVSFADYEAGKVKDDDLWLYSSFWYKDFDGMAYKTMLRQLISKWGIMSVEMQEAFDKDAAVIYENGSSEYVETSSEYAGAYEAAAPAPEASVDAPVVDGDVMEDFFSGSKK